MTVHTIAFDGDDTLWHNETIFSMTQEKFRALLAPYVEPAEIDRRLFATEIANLRLFGYGIKGFTLSMIETAIELSDARIPARDIQSMIAFGKAMLDHPVELLEGVRETIEALAGEARTGEATAGRFTLMVITKGDLFDQESKLARSGLGELFDRIEIVSEKDPDTYRRILARHGIAPEGFVMVGNSIRSDILPVLELGGCAVHIPYHVTWAHEEVDPPAEGYVRLGSMRELPGLDLLRD